MPIPQPEKKVLVIDDDPFLLKLVEKILSNSGYEVLSAQDVSSGIVAASKEMPHLIILDMFIKEKTGLDFLKIRKKQPALAHIPVFVLSASNDKKMVYSAITLGACDYLLKPVQAQLLIRKVKRILKEQSSLEWKPKAEKKEFVHATLKGKLTTLSNVSFRAELPVKLSPLVPISIKSSLFKECQIDQLFFKPIEAREFICEKGQFINEFTIVGIDKKASERIEKKIEKWESK